MAQIFPFRAYWLDPVRIEQSEFLSPVSEFISSSTQKGKLTSHRSSFPERICNIDQNQTFTDEEIDFSLIEEKIWGLSQSGKIKQDREPAIYEVVTEFFEPSIGMTRKRSGLLALMRLDDDGRIIYPHEKTFPDAVLERVKLFSSCSFQFDPVFMVYPGDYKKELNILESQKRQMFEIYASKTEKHSIYRISEAISIRKLVQYLNEKYFLIADGHHRYEAAFKAGVKSLLVYLVGSEDDGLNILPIHRLFKGKIHVEDEIEETLRKNFKATEVNKSDLLNFPANLSINMRNSRFFGYISKEKSIIFENNWESKLSDFILINKLVFENLPEDTEIHYSEYSDECIELVSRGAYNSCVLLNPLRLKDIWGELKKGGIFPEKSTSFYPKILGGMLLFKSG